MHCTCQTTQAAPLDRAHMYQTQGCTLAAMPSTLCIHHGCNALIKADLIPVHHLQYPSKCGPDTV